MKRSVLAVSVLCMGIVFGGYSVAVAARSSDASLSVSPSPCAHPGTYAVTGSGFKPGSRVAVMLSRQCSDGVTYTYGVYFGDADSSGGISFSRPTETCTGIYTLSAEEWSQSGHGRGTKATVSFVVY